ncbi:hypothetical protein HBH56_120590 [Parastagonospora nodorum]|uniref:Uncharacterized protein n=1 Tax=Phaeosphaeria nodorum (strain SN15 / ATCC MYA-4574 / FGSC 10173) TaxID=321614 RepID=A0A7U2FER8_PHANO|nr:hypothetical protein HBH56_120590 [Parastagonospora nodorum]QRD03957.1 hypothetical protein JI435_138140 [Parastagonospora nodorum SN15]KAH3924195.1 hypothetical protein HBH54_196490 [Parastagonospora nodorum]KAH3961598.1 hypothetical protein HBH51_182190 [Parastagonospora nodorum]KAH3968448.1 hypothetical protein HBH52_178950 [Parastagonospora nodorum]
MSDSFSAPVEAPITVAELIRASVTARIEREATDNIVGEAAFINLLAEPGLYQDEMARFVRNTFGIGVSQASVARKQNADLQSYYFHKVSQFCSYQLVFIDKSSCDKRIGTQRTSWSPVGTTPVQVTQFHRNQRHQILAAYTQDGVLLSRVY